MKNIGAKFRLSILLSAMIGLLSLGVRDVSASACTLSSGSYVVANGTSCTVELTQSNIDFFDNNIDVQVLITNPVSGNTTIQLSLLDAPSGLTLLGFDRFGFNGSILTYADGWDACSPHSPFNISDFGSFTACAKDGGGNDLSPIFVLNGDIGSFAANAPQGTHFVTHTRFGTDPSSSCSAFAGDSNVATKPIGEGECVGGGTDVGITDTQSVPEPSTMLLVGFGLVGLAAFSKSRVREATVKS